MACGSCGGNKAAAPATLRWVVDLNTPAAGDAKFEDGSKKKVYMTVQDANTAVVKLALQGKVRPRPATATD